MSKQFTSTPRRHKFISLNGIMVINTEWIEGVVLSCDDKRKEYTINISTAHNLLTSQYKDKDKAQNDYDNLLLELSLI